MTLARQAAIARQLLAARGIRGRALDWALQQVVEHVNHPRVIDVAMLLPMVLCLSISLNLAATCRRWRRGWIETMRLMRNE